MSAALQQTGGIVYDVSNDRLLRELVDAGLVEVDLSGGRNGARRVYFSEEDRHVVLRIMESYPGSFSAVDPNAKAPHTLVYGGHTWRPPAERASPRRAASSSEGDDGF